MVNDSIEEIFTGIGDLRLEALQKLVNQYYKEKIDITKELTKRLESLQQEALRQGSATSRFKQISKEMAFLWQLKAEIAAKDKRIAYKVATCPCGFNSLIFHLCLSGLVS